MNGRRILCGGLAALLLLATIRTTRAQDDYLDELDSRLTVDAWNNLLRMRLSGTLDLEGYWLQQPAPGLIFSESNAFFNPRLSLFLDAQLGPHLYAFVEARADNGFDPGEVGPPVRLDEYVLRYTPWDDGRLSVQVGKFATVVGTWSLRHASWENPFITAPLPYENLTGVWDTFAARTTSELLTWGGILPHPNQGGALLDEYRSLPIIWGPSYASGASVFGIVGPFEYAFEIKNASLSSRPETWAPTETQWERPTFSGRLGYQPNEMWSFGVSASTGTYLQASAVLTLAPGYGFGSYQEIVFGQDASFAWHHVQLWAEVYEARFEIPGVGNADTESYYVEAKYKLTPQFFAAIRWNQQLFGTLDDPVLGSVRWGRNAERIDFAPGYRLTPHIQMKLQYSLERQHADQDRWGSLTAVQFTVRF
ncbi:MAG TPA: hypothetical protein VGF85_12105 [Opitutaceae bacterium]